MSLEPPLLHLEPLITGLLYYFDSNNLEFLVKVLDGCSVNGHYWFFAAAATDANFTVTVTDTATGETRQYSNSSGEMRIIDLSAFATCP